MKLTKPKNRLSPLRISKTKKKSNKLQKESEYPNIKWDNILNKNVGIAILLYNDRVNTYRKMKALDAELDTKPTITKVKQMAELRIQNLQCFSELKSYNDTGQWRYEHPLIVNQSERMLLEDLLRKNPSQFLKDYASCEGNIKRYSSYLKSEKRKDNRKTDKINLQRHISRAKLFKSILEENDKND